MPGTSGRPLPAVAGIRSGGDRQGLAEGSSTDDRGQEILLRTAPFETQGRRVAAGQGEPARATARARRRRFFVKGDQVRDGSPVY